MPLEVKFGKPEEPNAVRTRLGRYICGTVVKIKLRKAKSRPVIQFSYFITLKANKNTPKSNPTKGTGKPYVNFNSPVLYPKIVGCCIFVSIFVQYKLCTFTH